jgi:Fe-S cluster biogenesis protein NfuA/nitrite reductase/ring-hydroxylating ferredoxin subunit
MAQHEHVRSTGDRIEAILEELRTVDDSRAATAGDELVRILVDLYGAGLARMMAVVGEDEEAGARLLDRLADDPLVESLLLVHDLHPVDVDTRIQRALDGVRPYLGSHAGGVRYLGVDETGVVHLALEGSCHGCPSSTVTVRLAIERAIQEAAPETAGVEVEGQVEEVLPGPALLQIGRRAPDAAGAIPARRGASVDGEGWAHLPEVDEAGLRPLAVLLAGVPVVVCGVDGAWYAYRDACPECGAAMSTGDLTDGVLRCGDCSRGYDVRLAGAGLTDPARHLDPLPLLIDGGGVRIAVGVGVR